MINFLKDIAMQKFAQVSKICCVRDFLTSPKITLLIPSTLLFYKLCCIVCVAHFALYCNLFIFLLNKDSQIFQTVDDSKSFESSFFCFKLTFSKILNRVSFRQSKFVHNLKVGPTQNKSISFYRYFQSKLNKSF